MWDDLRKIVRRVVHPRPIAAVATGPLARDETLSEGRIELSMVFSSGRSRLRAFRITQTETTLEGENQISEFASEKFAEGPQRIGEMATDQAGRFRSDGSPGMAQGDDHGVEREEERRLINQVAEKIAAFVRQEGGGDWKLAAPQTINSRILEELDPQVRGLLSGNEKHDFTKLPTLEVGRRFGLIK